MSFDTMLREHAPASHLMMRKFAYAAKGKHKASAGTKRLVLKDLSGFLDPAVLTRALDGKEVVHERTSSWDDVRRGLGDSESTLTDVAGVFAACDLHVLEVAKLAGNALRDEADAYFTNLFRSPLIAWRSAYPRLRLEVLFLVEVALQALSWWGNKLIRATGENPEAFSRITSLLHSGHRPMGNWLSELAAAAGVGTLPDLEKQLLSRGVKHLDRPVSANLIRKWSASNERLMPRTAMEAVVAVAKSEERRQLLRSRWYVVRYLTFLVAMVRAGTKGPRPEWSEVQDWLATRLQKAYELQRLAGGA